MIQDHLLAFEHNYSAAVLNEFPSGEARVLYYPGASNQGGRDGMAVAVTPQDRNKWIGVFAFGAFGASITAISSTPDPGTMCVVSKGAGYLIKPNKPEQWSDIPIVPITYLKPMPEHRMILLADYTSIAALGAEGLIWRTQRLSWDGISISRITTEHIEGEGWDPTTTRRPAFRVSLATGESSGGSSPETVKQR